MDHVAVRCSECYAKLMVAKKLVGTMIKCPKCKQTFYAEEGESYGLVEEPPPPAIRTLSEATEQSGPSRAQSHSKKIKPKPAAKPKRETKEEREQRERMEKWAEKME